MFRSLKWFALGMVLLCGLRTTDAKAQDTTPLTGSGVGQVIYQVLPTVDEPGIQVYVVNGNGTRLGNVTGTGITVFTIDGGVTGSFVATAADGSRINGDYSGSYEVDLETGTARFDVSNQWSGGTKRFAGLIGQSDTVAILDLLTGEFDFEHNGVWVLP